MNKGTLALEVMSGADWYNDWLLKNFSNFLSGDILEAGCGTGVFTEKLTYYGNTWALDSDEECIKKTSQLVGNKALVGYGNLEADRFFFKNKKFNSIVCLNVLEHIKNEGVALNNLYRLLKTGGYLVLLVPAHNWLFGEMDKTLGHLRRYDKKKLAQKIELTGFKIVSNKRLNLFGAIGWYISGRILKNKIIDGNKLRIFSLFAPFLLLLERIAEPPVGISILLIAKK